MLKCDFNKITLKLKCCFTEITRQHRCSPVNLLHIFRIYFPKNTYGGLVLKKIKIFEYLKNKIAIPELFLQETHSCTIDE